MALDARVGQARVLVAAELVDGVVHDRVVEHAERDQQLEVAHLQTRHLLEQPWLELRDDVLQALLAIVREVHEHGDARRELDELLLDLLALALELLLLLGELLLLLGGERVLLLLSLLHGLGLVDDGLDVGVEAAEALDAHEGAHGLRAAEEAAQRVVVHVDEKRALPAARQQRRGGPDRDGVEDVGGVDLAHGGAVIGEHRQELDELPHLALGARLVDREPAAVVGDHDQRTVEGKVEDVALLLEDLRLALLGNRGPGALHAKRRLEVGLGTLEVAQHEHAAPGLDGHARGELAARERDRLGGERVPHGVSHGPDRVHAHARLVPCRNDYLVVVEERVLPLGEEVGHRLAGRHVG